MPKRAGTARSGRSVGWNAGSPWRTPSINNLVTALVHDVPGISQGLERDYVLTVNALAPEREPGNSVPA